jgi:hypothetical protein
MDLEILGIVAAMLEKLSGACKKPWISITYDSLIQLPLIEELPNPIW